MLRCPSAIASLTAAIITAAATAATSSVPFIKEAGGGILLRRAFDQYVSAGRTAGPELLRSVSEVTGRDPFTLSTPEELREVPVLSARGRVIIIDRCLTYRPEEAVREVNAQNQRQVTSPGCGVNERAGY